MADRPIIFSAPMVRALLDGRKTQTRRVLRPQPSDYAGATSPPPSLREKLHAAPYFDRYHKGPFWCWWDEYDRQGPDWIKVPFSSGDRLWVKETYVLETQVFGVPEYPPPHQDGRPIKHDDGWLQPHYRATDPEPVLDYDGDEGCKWKPSIFMPRWASRLTLLVTDVRVQRLQDISEADALAEGIEMESADPPFYYVPHIWPHSLTAVGIEQSRQPAIDSFAKLWGHINGPGAWDENPWVAAISFDVVRGNIDQVQP